MIDQQELSIDTSGRGSNDITDAVQRLVGASGIKKGICQVFIFHTSASLMLCENADPDVREDLETFMARIAPDGDPDMIHTAEGPDDMPAHIRSILTTSSLSMPVDKGRCALGTWQGIFLWEHRLRPHNRRLLVTTMGEPGS